MTIDSEPGRKIERTGRSPLFYKKVFGDLVAPGNAASILDVGAGDSGFAMDMNRQNGPIVTRIDVDYADNPPIGDNWASADATDLSDFRGRYDVALSVFMMQHLSQQGQARAIDEMIQATIVRTEESLGYQGVIGIYPVYKRDRLEKMLEDAGFLNNTAVRGTAGASDVELTFGESANDRFTTLYIVNDDRIDEARRHELATLIASSGALSRRRTVGDMARRAFMKPGITKVR